MKDKNENTESEESHRDMNAASDPERTAETTAWESVPTRPVPPEVLGYETESWEQFRTLDGSDQVMFLPTDESSLKENAFLVADQSAVVDLDERV